MAGQWSQELSGWLRKAGRPILYLPSTQSGLVCCDAL